MTFLKKLKEPNGDIFDYTNLYSCDRCNENVHESHPHHVQGPNEHYCWSCAFILGLITEKEYLEYCSIKLMNLKAGVVDGKIVLWTGKKPPWEKTDKEMRNTKKYKDWRTKVFERDEYTCQKCGQVGGELNAHHIKPYATHKKLRFDLNNGVTLCVSCHRKEHRKEG